MGSEVISGAMRNCHITGNFLLDVVPLLPVSHSGGRPGPTLNSTVSVSPPLPCRSPAGASALVRRGVLAADGGLLERRPLPEAAARHRGAQPAEHHGADVRLRLEAEEQQPGGLKLNKQTNKQKATTLPQANARVACQLSGGVYAER